MNADTRELLASHLIVDEGVVLHAYRDSLGYLTIGCGRLIDKRKGGGITNAEALMLLQNDIERHWTELIERFPWVLRLEPARQAALANLAFNLGVPGLAKFVNTLGAIQRGAWSTAANGLRNSLWYRQVAKSRSERIIAMIVTGEFPEGPS